VLLINFFKYSEVFYADMNRSVVELLLGDHFVDYSPNDDVISEFKRGMRITVSLLEGVQSDERLFKALAELLTSQWTNPVLIKILNGDELDKDTGL